MTGTGTQNDPFIVDNWPDFVTAVETAGAYVEFPEGGGIIDMNNVAPTGIPTINIKCASIEGNGWTISNLYCVGCEAFYITNRTTGSKVVSITELNFLNFYFDAADVNYPSFFSAYDLIHFYAFKRCAFSGIAMDSKATNQRTNIFMSEVRLEQCSINVCCNGNTSLNRNGGYSTGDKGFRFCNIKISGDSDNTLQNANFVNCYFSGKSADISIATTYKTEANYNVFNVDFSEASTFNCTGNSGTINLINTDLLPDGATIGTGFVGVTTEQLQDASYLASLGFPIGVD